jgi:bifunctional non-homologous end joining protein LigD
MAKRDKAAPRIEFTHTEKVFFGGDGFTKGQLIRYYVDAAKFILPHLKGRPVTLIRYPDGIGGEKFYAKNAPKFTPTWIKTCLVPRRHDEGDIHYILVNDLNTLAWCANIAAIEFHPFLHRAPRLDQPTAVAFDLDPGEGSDLSACARVAFLIKGILDSLGLRAFPKVSGSKGLQVYVPLNSKVTYAATGAFAKAVAEYLEQEHPEHVVSMMTKIRRRGRVLIDWSQNSASKTTICVYSIRGKRDEPFVSMPVTWDELKGAKASRLLFHPDEAIRRMRKVGDLFGPVLTLKQSLPKAFMPGNIAVSAPLTRYEAKRDFTKTAEPRAGRVALGKAKEEGRFVIQKHAASHLHYDFRLEMDGTLKSWAVPKGLSTDLGVKRSAFAVEDHPIGYLKFEGTIPKGQYGGGTVMVWDIGTYELLGGSYHDGNLKLMLHGKKLKGEWHMFKIRSEGGKDVWLISKSKVAARAVSERQDDSSVLTRRSMARIGGDNDAQWLSSDRRPGRS